MNILTQIIKNKKKELNTFKSGRDIFKKTFKDKKAKIIGEIKLKSPNNLNISINNLENIQKFYKEKKEIKAISILIDKKYFSGEISRIVYFKEKSKKLTFFKEFVISKNQIDGASYYGYDALLLIKKILKDEELIEFINYANSKNIYPIVEVDNEKDFKNILTLSDVYDFGIALNSRNLTTMKIDKTFHFKIFEKYEKILENKIIFAFSGIEYEDLKNYKNKFNGVLIGSYFMKILLINLHYMKENFEIPFDIEGGEGEKFLVYPTMAEKFGLKNGDILTKDRVQEILKLQQNIDLMESLL